MSGRMDDGDRMVLWGRIQELERKVEFLDARRRPPVPAAAERADGRFGPESMPVSEDVLMLVRAGKKVAAIKQLRAQTGLSLVGAKHIVDSLG
ncbi:MAG TPA: hypothetical protein VHW44_24715 [Pseudonocardiaceae bacterium]|jgi:ribosomal protein L7/L12|nr:hypothetical protein [Pseudonocardiaceae bacterium]